MECRKKLAGKELVDILRKSDMNICCVQNKLVKDILKIIYSENTSTRSGVEVMEDEELKGKVVEYLQ